ncbi:MAG TPA: hypothetical protein VGK25_10140 [Ignavibacteria bacterium]|jgi:hypothetical protein
MKNKLSVLLIIFLGGYFLEGCLSVETKEYSFKLKGDKSGDGKIKYINIMRSSDSLGTVESDYNDLIDNYLNGNKLESELTGIKNIKKRLFEEDDQLCGEMTFDFDDITKLKFYNYNNKVLCYFLGSNPMNIFGSSETYFSSNGTFAGETFPVIFWDIDQKKFELKTSLTQPSEKTTSLLEMWNQKGEK